jgi:hypothetical protein
LKLLFLHENLAGWTAVHLRPEWVQHSAVREIVARRCASHSDGTWTSLAAFLDACESAEMQNLITEAVTEARAIPNPEQQLADVVLRLRNLHLDRQVAALTQLASRPTTSEPQHLELLHQQQALRQAKRQPLAPTA